MRSEGGRGLALALASVLGCNGDRGEDVTRRSGHAVVDAARDETILLARRARESDRSAGIAACALVRERPVDPRAPRLPEVVTAAYAVIAATKTECEELTAALVDHACDARLDCGPEDARRLCTPDDLAAEVERVVDAVALDGGVPSDVADRRILLAAGHALPALPGRMRKQSDRRRYEVAQPEAPPCSAQPVGTRAPCRCLETPMAIADASCASTHSDEHDVAAGCRVRVDDDRRQLVVLHRTD